MFKNKLKPQFGKLSIILLVVIAVLLASDLVTKYLEEAYSWHAVIIPDFIVIRFGVRNQGCAFSFLDENPQIGQPILITLTFILLAVLIFGFIFMPNRLIVLKTAVSMLIAGALGNLGDRLAFFEVRDWFGLNIFGRLAFCNFADFWIVLGAILAVVDMLFFCEYAVFPLTKSAKAAQKAKKEEEERKKAKDANSFSASADEEPLNETDETHGQARKQDTEDNNL